MPMPYPPSALVTHDLRPKVPPMSSLTLTRLGVFSFILSMTVTTPVLAADEQTTLTLDSRDLHSLKLFAGEGYLHIQGVDNSEAIEVVGNIVGGREGRRFTLTKDGDVAVLSALNTERHFVFAWIGQRPRIDVTVKVPSRLMLEVRDGPGKITIGGMKADATVIDDNGAMRVSDHHGSLKVFDGHGDIELKNITGQVYVQDGHGHLSVESVVGNVSINDGNGSIVVKTVDGHVNIHDGNGGVATANVTHGVTINDGRSGQLAVALDKEKQIP